MREFFSSPAGKLMLLGLALTGAAHLFDAHQQAPSAPVVGIVPPISAPAIEMPAPTGTVRLVTQSVLGTITQTVPEGSIGGGFDYVPSAPPPARPAALVGGSENGTPHHDDPTNQPARNTRAENAAAGLAALDARRARERADRQQAEFAERARSEQERIWRAAARERELAQLEKRLERHEPRVERREQHDAALGGGAARRR